MSSGEFEEAFYQDSVNLRYGRDLNQVDFISYFLGIGYLEGMDYIIRMEDLENEFAKMPFIGETSYEIPFENVTEKKWRPRLDDEVKDLIYQWAKDDFYAFNYGR